MARPHIEPYVELNDPYRKFDIAGFRGSLHKVLSLDPDTGACTLKVRFNGGYRRKPGLSYSDFEVFVLNGEIRVGRECWGEGHYAFIPAGVALPALAVPQGAEALVMFNDSEPNFEESGESHPLALAEGLVSLNAYEDRPWFGGGRVQPSVATGCLSKVLRMDPLTEAYTFLYCMVPRYEQDNISYHDCAEESYHIWGTSWMMQFGELPTGGYFWRPPYINHGSFRCTYGTLALGRTDSKLHNYFHYNPWTNPQDNLRRAAARHYRQRPQLYRWQASDGHNHPHGPPDYEAPDYGDDAHVRALHDR
ncbi:MAG: hypothetical protein AMXMBFR45_10620 [Gammaproteobacteria bacterium]|nr:MAG: DUF4437 domain-containing protein [Pseudomonadota bacterium]MBC6944523.1 DUF4437 domain-containing protein [Gammaproteobacteria bacterium]MCE7896514.1 DUF4437 domain-containing protein [Gammaproteobacteria bacterium PRO8]MDL1880957.1 DUF4437 domain-containing protein [Gammaproteobacteria bacterium PRO2]GIK34658.1 MAG: hypothetical protein BroJett010_12170 [Gammaproteobacteria bacterium]